MAANSYDTTTGRPIFVDTDPPDIKADPTQSALYAADVGNRIIRANLAALNAYAYKRKGLTGYTLDTGRTYVHNGTGWVDTLSEDTDWQTITSFRNGFSSSTTTTDTVKVRCLNGVIYLKGGLMRATAPISGVIAFGVPPRFRPGAQVRLAIRPDLGAHIIIETNGAVTITATTASPGPTGAGYVLNGVSFIAEN